MEIKVNINMKKELAEYMHKVYEEESKKAGWETQKKTRKSFAKLPKENREVMLRMAEAVSRWFTKHGNDGHDDFYNYICIKKELFEEIEQ